MRPVIAFLFALPLFAQYPPPTSICDPGTSPPRCVTVDSSHNLYVLIQNSSIAITASSLPLPTGASTSALQSTGNGYLSTLAGGVSGGIFQTAITGALPAFASTPAVSLTGSWPYSGTLGNVGLLAGTNTIGSVQGTGNAAFGSDQTSIASTATQLPSHACRNVCVSNLSTNAASIFLGATGVTTSTGDELTAGAKVCYNVSNSNLIYGVVSTGSETLTLSFTN